MLSARNLVLLVLGSCTIMMRKFLCSCYNDIKTLAKFNVAFLQKTQNNLLF